MGIRFKRSIFVLLIAVFPACRHDITLMTYNVENLFDDRLDGSEYPEFRPETDGWNSGTYHQKLEAIAKVIGTAYSDGPDIVTLQEIENLRVLNDLCDIYLNRSKYGYRVFVPKAGLANNIAVLSRLPINRVRSHYVGPWHGDESRNILEVEIEYRGNILFLFNNHWKSKIGGILETETARLEAAAVLVRRIKEIREDLPNADIIIAGDLNENTGEYNQIDGAYRTALIPIDASASEDYSECSLFLTAEKAELLLVSERLVFYEPWYEQEKAEGGSLVYNGEWQTPDHILLSGGLFDEKGFYYKKNSFKAVKEDFFINGETGYPLKWYTGSDKYGYSDHLPLMVTISIR